MPGDDHFLYAADLTRARPLALATSLPPDTAAAIATHPTYGALFEAAFGDGAITPARIAFARATYQRTLVADQTPYDRFAAGDATALSARALYGWKAMQTTLREWVDDPAATPADLDQIAARDESAWEEQRNDILLYR